MRAIYAPVRSVSTYEHPAVEAFMACAWTSNRYPLLLVQSSDLRILNDNPKKKKKLWHIFLLLIFLIRFTALSSTRECAVACKIQIQLLYFPLAIGAPLRFLFLSPTLSLCRTACRLSHPPTSSLPLKLRLTAFGWSLTANRVLNKNPLCSEKSRNACTKKRKCL